jgi:hypothetical protein
VSAAGNYINIQDLQQNILSQVCVPVNEGFLTKQKRIRSGPYQPVRIPHQPAASGRCCTRVQLQKHSGITDASGAPH